MSKWKTGAFLKLLLTVSNIFLQTWDWNYGRTPKFTCAVHNRFNFGELVSSNSVILQVHFLKQKKWTIIIFDVLCSGESDSDTWPTDTSEQQLLILQSVANSVHIQGWY